MKKNNTGSPSAREEFPQGFLWGTASASYQIEGSPLADGAGESIWHRFTHTPGKTERGETGDIACDHYRLWRDDVALMAELGLKAYRFSIAWGRLLPDGVGRVNQAGLDFYSRLIDELLAHGITPMVTLFHWDYPQALQDRGGCVNRDHAGWFGEYAALTFKHYSDRVKCWLTLNEPAVFTNCGYRSGCHAPGLQDWDAMLAAGHNLMRGHGRAVQALRSIDAAGKIGVAFALGTNLPDRDTPEDHAAARRNRAFSRRFCDPIMLGEYPPRFLEMVKGHMPPGFEKDLPLIHQPVDLVGVNYYSQWRVTHDPSVPFLQSRGVAAWDEGNTRTDSMQSSFAKKAVPERGKRGEPLMPIGWAVLPEGLRETLLWARNRYGNYDFYVTENNALGCDESRVEDAVHDQYRIDYLRSHFLAARQAIADGVNLKGYMVWSLMDNLEWASGFRIRAGLAHVDFKTNKRTLKDSARWYRGVIQGNRV